MLRSLSASGSVLAAAGIAAAFLVPSAADAQQVGDVFIIALENHNFVNPSSVTSPAQIFGNPNAPYINSLITPGNPNAAQTAYATNYLNAGNNVHPSEPNYVWAQAGSNLGNSTDNDPTTTLPPTQFTGGVDGSTNAANWYSNRTLTDQLDSAGIRWKNYQEDVQYSTAPTKSASGMGGTAPSGLAVITNPYNGTTQYNYAVKHNPMGFFPTSANRNVSPISALATDLAANTVGRYNWITPDQYNDMHSTLTTPFTYHGTTYPGSSGTSQQTDAQNIAQGDNFLSIIVPQIMASAAYQNNGAIIIWNDETEGGDVQGETSTEIVISPLAKGNAFASNVSLNHSSDVKSFEELFGLPFLDNAIPTDNYDPAGGAGTYNTVAGSNDLSSLFVPNAIPEPTALGLVGLGGLAALRRRRTGC